MKYSLTAVGGTASELDSQIYQTVGAVCQIAGRSKSHALVPLQKIVEQLRMPMELKQVEVFFNHFGTCVGYATWAYVCHDVEQRLLRGGRVTLQDFEWNEGNSLWIIDFLVLNGSLKSVMTALRDKQLAQSQTVTYFRHKNGKRICKRLSRNDYSHFWTESNHPAITGGDGVDAKMLPIAR